MRGIVLDIISVSTNKTTLDVGESFTVTFIIIDRIKDSNNSPILDSSMNAITSF